MLAIKALSALLLYPDEALRPALPDIARALRTAPLPAAERKAAAAFCDRLAAQDTLAAQGEYIALFDSGRALSLHLFEHVHGDSRDRGSALAALLDDYRAAGLELAADELPDFLPVFLEYASMHTEAEARALLGEVADILALLAARLEARNSGYTAVMRALEALAARPADRDAVAARVAEDRPDHTPEALDAAYEETPVTFMEPAAPEAPCPKAAEIVARFAETGA